MPQRSTVKRDGHRERVLTVATAAAAPSKAIAAGRLLLTAGLCVIKARSFAQLIEKTTTGEIPHASG